MTAKEYLRQVRVVDCQIDSKLEQVMRLRETATKATATLSDMPRSDSPNLQTLESTVVKIIDLENEINQDIDRLVDLKREARVAIDSLMNPEQQMILELRYLCYKAWPEIADTMGFSESNVYRLHGIALKNITLPKKIGVKSIELE